MRKNLAILLELFMVSFNPMVAFFMASILSADIVSSEFFRHYGGADKWHVTVFAFVALFFFILGLVPIRQLERVLNKKFGLEIRLFARA